MGEGHKWDPFPECGAKLGYHLLKGPIFGESPHPRALPYTSRPSYQYRTLYDVLSFTLHFKPWLAIQNIA